MFKTLFATLLMSVNIATPMIKTNTYKATAMTSISGGYVLRDDFSSLRFDYDDDFEYDVYGSWIYPSISCYAYSQSENGWELVRSVSVGFDTEDHYYYVNLDIGEDRTAYIFQHENLVDLSNYFQQLIIYFDFPFYLPNNKGGFFNSLFTGQGNNFTEFYRGYYSLIGSQLNHQVTFDVLGPMLVDNSLYNEFSSGDGVGVVRNINTNTPDYIVFENNQLKVIDQNIYLDGVLLPASYKLAMQQIGIFGYVRDTSYDNATFSDLLFSVMDTPIYFITRLLSFELFGVDLFVAFTGLLTICVLLFLIRKFF